MPKYLLLFLLLLAVPACRAVGAEVTPAQLAKVKAVLERITVNDEASLTAAEDALVAEGVGMLPALAAAPVETAGQPGVGLLTMQQAGVVREAIAHLTWKINPRALVNKALSAGGPLAVFQRPVTVTDLPVIRTFPDALFYSVTTEIATTTVSGTAVTHANRATFFLAVKKDGTVQRLPDQKAMEAFFVANVPPVPVTTAPTPPTDLNKPEAQFPGAPAIHDTTYAWTRLSELYNAPGIYLAFDANQVNVHLETAMTATLGAKPRSWLVGTLLARPAPDSGYIGSYDAECSYDPGTGKLLSCSVLDMVRSGVIEQGK